MRFRFLIAAATAALLANASAPARANLFAIPPNTVDAVYFNGTFADTEPQDHLVPGSSPPVFEIGAIPILNPTGADFVPTGSADTAIHVSGDSIKLTSETSGPYCLLSEVPCTDQIDGFEFTFSSGVDITGAKVDPASQFGVFALDLKSPTDLLVNLTGINVPVAGDSLTIDLTFPGAIPEPSTWALMLLGFAGLGFAGWRRRTAQTT
jgi:hypothetical protein